jgi:carbon storage regulator
MLVLSRNRDETIMIGDDIEITIVDIRGDKVRLGINAPPSVAVHRKEVYEAIKRENQAASGLSGTDLAGLRPHVDPGPVRSQLREQMRDRARDIASPFKPPVPPKRNEPPQRGAQSA